MGYHDPMTTTHTTATYRQPFTGTPIPCRLVTRYTTDKGRKVAAIIISAEHSGTGADLDLTVADRSVEDSNGPDPGA